MLSRDRRLRFRVPVEMYLDQYICERRYRGLTTGISETGLSLRTAFPAGSIHRIPGRRAMPNSVSLEFELPGTGESIWARGELWREERDAFAISRGIRFTAMAVAHARLLHDFCIETRRSRLGSIIAQMA